LPISDPPAIFGLHDNAEITSGLHETSQLLDTLISLQPRTTVLIGSSTSSVIHKLASDILQHLPLPLDLTLALKKFPVSATAPLHSFLKQEIILYNK
jgi:dynein heavy chain